MVDSRTVKTTPTPNPLAAMVFFFIVTSVYCIISMLIGGDKTQKLMMKVAYVLFVILGEFFINLNLSNALCGINQWQSTLFITLVPWVTIFCMLHIFLAIFPGWLSPFSNTFGYLIAKLMGLPELMKAILVPVGDGETAQALINVSNDGSLLINQFSPESYVVDQKTPENPNGTGKKIREKFQKAWKKLQAGKILKPPVDVASDLKNIDKLYYFVDMKYTISEYVWNLLTGFLVTSISYNYIINIGCSKSPKEMKERHDAYEAAEAKKSAVEKESTANDPIYVQQA
jgi:hypothetical protein